MKKTVKAWGLYNSAVGLLSAHSTKEDAQNESDIHTIFVYKIIPCTITYELTHDTK